MASRLSRKFVNRLPSRLWPQLACQPVSELATRTLVPSFDSDVEAALANVRADAIDALGRQKTNPQSNSLRLHALQGYGKLTIYKIDVRPR